MLLRQHPAPLTGSLTHAELARLLEAPTAYNRESVNSTELLGALLPRIQKYRRQMDRVNLGIGLGIGLFVPVILIVLVILVPLLGSMLLVTFIVGLLVGGASDGPNFFSPLASPFVPYGLTEALTLAARQLEREPSADVIPALLDLLVASGDPRLSSDAARCLSQLRHKATQLLPYLAVGSARALSPTQRGYLRERWLQPWSEPVGQVSSLLVLASAQDTESLPLARALLSSSTNEAVKEAARELLSAGGG